jgi:hypothetical protein
MAPPTNSNESYCTFTLASDVTAGGLPSEAEIAKDLESTDDNVSANKRFATSSARNRSMVSFVSSGSDDTATRPLAW